MIINSIIIYCLLNFYLLTGNFFLKFSGPKSIYRNSMLSEKIIAGFFFINFFFLVINFFFPTQHLFILIIFLLFCFFITLKYFFLIKKNFKFFFIIALLFSPLSIYIDPGFDAGLYHLPFQKILQDQNIHFGLSNIHNRYGLTGITNYFNSFLWNKKFVNILSSNQTILFLTFFLIIKDNMNLNKGYLNIYIICAIFTFPIWYRYAPLQYGTIDIIFSVFIFIHFLYLSKLIFKSYDKHRNFEEIFYIFCLSTSFAFAVKPTGLLLIINLIIVCIFLYKKILTSFKKLFFNNYIFIIFFIIWFFRNLIISGCIIYPIVFTCFNFDWFDLHDTLNVNTSVKIWNSQYLNLLGDNFLKLYPNFLFVFLSIILLFFITVKFFINSILYFCIKYKIYIFSILFVFFSIFSLYLIEIKNLVYLLEQKKLDEFILIIKKEFFYILVYFVISLFVLFLSFDKKFKFSLKSQIDFKFFLPLFFFLILFFFWFFNAPQPRLGQFLLFLFLPSIVFIFFQYRNIKYNKLTYNFIYISIFFVIINLSILNNLKKIQYKDIFFYQMRIPETDILKRNSFGYKPQNLQLQCWAEANCYPYEDVFIYKKISSYNFYKKF
jgi:hypothetical protein